MRNMVEGASPPARLEQDAATPPPSRRKRRATSPAAQGRRTTSKLRVFWYHLEKLC